MKSVLFDYGGTLDADGTTWIERFYPLYRESGILIDRNDFDRAFHACDDSLPKLFALDGLDLEKTVRLQVDSVLKTLAPTRAALASKIAGRFTADSRRQFGILKPLLRRLCGRYRLGIVSNFYGNLEGLLRAEGLLPYFGIVADSGALGMMKPDPAIFLHAARALDSHPEECLMVGDSVPRDVKGAVAAGMKVALVCASAATPQAGQNWTIRSVAELEAVLT